jgi:zinc protease
VNEEPGRTGFAHLFEHMMFEETKHVPKDEFGRLLEMVGASDLNGTTDFDRTNYFETVPSNELELALWLESDRMGYLLDKVDAEALKNQQDVVRNERRQSVENQPFGIVEEAMYHTLFPKSHPYYGNVIGSHQDIQAAKLDDVRRFFRQYYSPNNATLAIVGDIDKAKTIKMVEKYFGSLKKGPAVPAVRVNTPRLTTERRITVKDRIEMPRVYMAWITPPIFKPGDAEADLAARILADGRSSRLYKSLVYEKQIAQNVVAYQYSLTLGSVFVVQATARKGHTLEELEKAIEVQLDALRSGGPDAAELGRAKTTVETQTLFSLERLGGFGGVANRINLYNHHLKNPDYLAEDILRYRRVTREQVQQFAQRSLARNARVVVYGVAGEPDLGTAVPTPDKPLAATAKTESVNPDEPWRVQRPPTGPASTLTFPTPETFKLANGLQVVLNQRKGVPVVSSVLVFLGGNGSNPIDKPGLASITLDLLRQGTKSRTATQFADQLAQIGAELRTTTTNDSAYMTFTAMKSRYAQLLDLVSDVTVNPTFPAAELEREQQSRLGTLAEQRENPSAIADKVLAVALHGPRSPYGYARVGTESSIRSMKVDDLRAYWSQNMLPNNAALVVSGDISAAELRPLLDSAFSKWSAGAVKPPDRGTIQQTSARVVIVDKPGAPQSQLRVAMAGPSRSTPDFESLQVMNGILGGTFSSRINMNLREEKGYTYGANSFFTYLRNGGWFSVYTGVRTDVTIPSVREIVREISRIVETPVTAAELKLSRDGIIGQMPSRFETSEDTVGQLTNTFVFELGPDFYSRYAKKLADVTEQKVAEVARRYLAPEKLIFVIVGDRGKIEEEIRKLGLGTIEIRDADGNLIPR